MKPIYQIIFLKKYRFDKSVYYKKLIFKTDLLKKMIFKKRFIK